MLMSNIKNIKLIIDPNFIKLPSVNPDILNEFCHNSEHLNPGIDWVNKWHVDHHNDNSIYDPQTRKLNTRFLDEVMTVYAIAVSDINTTTRNDLNKKLQIPLSYMLRELKIQSTLLDMKRLDEISDHMLGEFWDSHFTHSIAKFIKNYDLFTNCIPKFPLDSSSAIKLLQLADNLNLLSSVNPVPHTEVMEAEQVYSDIRLQELLIPIYDFAKNIALSPDTLVSLAGKKVVEDCADNYLLTFNCILEQLTSMRRLVIYDPQTVNSLRFKAMEKQIDIKKPELDEYKLQVCETLHRIGIDQAIIHFVEQRFSKADELYYELSCSSKEFFRLLNMEKE